MEANEKKLFNLTDETGTTYEFELLFTFESDETGKNYIVYADTVVDENGNIKTYASTYDPKLENLKLEPVTTEKEWKTIEALVEKFNTENKDEQ